MTTREEVPMSVRVPADVARPDTIAFGLTARHLVLVTSVGVGLWLLYTATRTVIPLAVFAGIALPVLGATVGVVLIRRHGLGLDQLLLAAWRQRRGPRRLVPADTDRGGRVPGVPAWIDATPGELPAPLRLPASAITADGVIDLGAQGVAVVSACSSVNFGLRTPGEQHALVAGFARWLHSLTAPVQIVVRADRLDLAPVIARLEDDAAALPHPALEDACRDHAAFLTELSRSRDLLRRQILLVLTEPTPPGRTGRDAAGQVALRRAQDAARALAASEVTVTCLDGAHAHAALAAATNPDATNYHHRSAPGVVTGTPDRPEVTPR